MFKNRVYIEDEKEAPSDATVRRGDRGKLYYVTDERGNNHHVGSDKENELLETDKEELDKKVYVGSHSEAPDGVILESDDNGLFYREQVYDLMSEEYPEDLEDESEVDMPEAEDADGPE